MENRRLLLAALLSVAVLLVWQFVFPPPKPTPRPAASPEAASSAAPQGSAATAGGSTEATKTAAEGAPAASAPAAQPEADAAALTPVSGQAEEHVVLENDLLRAEFSSRGAQLVSLVLKGKTAEEGRPLELVQQRAPGAPYPFALVDEDGGSTALDTALFAVEQTKSPEPSVTFRFAGAAGGADKQFRLHPDGRLDFTISLAGGVRQARILIGPGLRVRTAAELGNRFNQRAVIWRSGGAVSLVDARNAKEEKRLPGRGLEWVGLETTYFLTAVVPQSGLAEVVAEPVLLVPSEGGEKARIFTAKRLAPGAELSDQEKKYPRDYEILLSATDGKLAGTSFWGAKQYDRLAGFPWKLEETVRWGWLGFLSRPLLRGLQWIHAHVTSNWGWAIVLLTIALKLALFPLSLASFKSMRKMQILNPKMQAIRERYRPKLRDKKGRYNPELQRQMNAEIMALYKQEGVNPAGGCLPMLVQLPIFFAFYELLRNAVELWQAPWMLWIHDLSAFDPYYVLPILMGISQFAQQKMSPPPPDATQRRMMQLLPVVFTVFSFGFPAGLVLYWLTNNLFTIGQQTLYNRMHQNDPLPVVATSPKGGRERKRK